MSKELELRIYDRSIQPGEYRELRRAIEEAHKEGTVTYLNAYPGQHVAIVPAEAAQWWESFLAGLCPACHQDSHAHCLRYAGTPVDCTCTNVNVHAAIEMERLARAGLLSRRHR
jgi:hypothetical protein